MARKPNPSPLRTTRCDTRASERPWLKSYPQGVAWDARFRPGLVGSLLDQAVQAYGRRPCTYFMGKRLSFAEIGELSDRAAKGLRALGVSEGVKVGLLLPNSPTFVIFYYGVLKAGGTIVNFNPLYSLEEIEFQIRDSGTKIMVTLDLALTFEKVEAMLKRGALDKAVVASFPSLLPSLKSVGFKLLQRTKLANTSASTATERIVPEQALLANDGRYDRPAITPEAIAVLQYTGGTTGTPKGAMLSHANLTINVGQVRAWQNRQVSESDRMLGILPLFHVFAMTTVMNFGVASGMEIILLPTFELIQTLKLIGKLRPTMMPGVPALFNADRIKDMINAAGFKVYPRRIEDALHEHAAVAEVCVVGVPDDYRGEAPKAYVRLKEGAHTTAAELCAFLRPKLSKLELPAAIEFRDELPKTMIGKLSKLSLIHISEPTRRTPISYAVF